MQFFSGATLLIRGPAELDILSDWRVRVHQGNLRATVPDVARGFSVETADEEIVDLESHIALDVDASNHLVRYIDRELTTDEALDRRSIDRQRRRFEAWRDSTNQIKADPRVIGHFPIGLDATGADFISVAGADDKQAFMVGNPSWTEGRFGHHSHAIAFDRPGSRIRTRFDDTYDAFTLMCWVKIDSLPHRYNALFMSDGYENGELHWQIRYDGHMMFSVMVDDQAEVFNFSRFENALVQDAGRHRVYLSDEAVWDLSRSGRWMHLAAIYDPAGRRVTLLADGQVVGESTIPDDLLVTDLRIGSAEIGNWGQPFRDTPAFAVRNLNGAIDELCFFNAALSQQEIKRHFDSGNPEKEIDSHAK
ncbi:MAG: LamG domain-containing protein [Planctomycetota bacterium]